MDYGIPLRFKTDNRTVFNYETAKTKAEHKDVLTQFGYACKTLGTDIVTTSVSQVERANQTVQSRLKPELRLHNITTIEDANKYLREVFVPKFNDKFGQDIHKFESAFADSPNVEKINYTLAVLSPRSFDSGSAISYKNHYYQATDASNKLICFAKGTKCLIIQAFDDQVYSTDVPSLEACFVHCVAEQSTQVSQIHIKIAGNFPR